MRAPSMLFPVILATLYATSAARGEDDPAKEARLAAAEGRFDEVESIMERAPPNLLMDAALHKEIAEEAVKYTEGKEHEEKRPGLDCARDHFASSFELAADSEAAADVLDVTREIIRLDESAQRLEQVKADVKYAFEFGEKALAAGVTSPEFKVQLGRMYGVRAMYVKSMAEVDQLVDDSTKCATLLTEASVGNPDGGALLSEAAKIRLRAADLIHEGIPRTQETRDDDALHSALALATDACNRPGATEVDYGIHLEALRLAHAWGLKAPAQPYMQPLTPSYAGLRLMVPKAGGWKLMPSNDYDRLFERRLSSDEGVVQIMLKRWKASDGALGGKWGELEDMAQRRFEKYTTSDFEEAVGKIEPQQLTTKKDQLETWYYAASGQFARYRGRRGRIAEFIFFGDRRKDTVIQLKIVDWRQVPDVEEPDIVAFVASALGDGVWSGSVGGTKDGDKPKESTKDTAKKPKSSKY